MDRWIDGSIDTWTGSAWRWQRRLFRDARARCGAAGAVVGRVRREVRAAAERGTPAGRSAYSEYPGVHSEHPSVRTQSTPPWRFRARRWLTVGAGVPPASVATCGGYSATAVSVSAARFLYCNRLFYPTTCCSRSSDVATICLKLQQVRVVDNGHVLAWSSSVRTHTCTYTHTHTHTHTHTRTHAQQLGG